MQHLMKKMYLQIYNGDVENLYIHLKFFFYKKKYFLKNKFLKEKILFIKGNF